MNLKEYKKLGHGLAKQGMVVLGSSGDIEISNKLVKGSQIFDEEKNVIQY